MKNLLLSILLLISASAYGQIEVKDAMPFEASPSVTTVVTVNFEKLPFWRPGELIIFKVPATNTGTVKINTVSATMGATTQTFPAGTEVTIPPLTVYKNIYIQMSVGADKLLIYR